MEIKVVGGNANLYKESINITVLAFGKVKINTPLMAKIRIEGVDSSSLTATCGCTATQSEEKNVYTIEYKHNHLAEPFAKTLILSYRESGKNLTSNIKITGNIIK